MTEAAINYARVLYELSVPKEQVREAEQLLLEEPLVLKVLKSPVIRLREKQRIIRRMFPKEIHRFLSVVCGHKRTEELQEIFREYWKYAHQEEGIVDAVLEYVTMPKKEQEEKISAFLAERYRAKKVELNMTEKPELIGGFILRVNNEEYDWSLRGRLQKLEQKLTRR